MVRCSGRHKGGVCPGVCLPGEGGICTGAVRPGSVSAQGWSAQGGV